MARADRPNIVFILTDDQAYHVTGAGQVRPVGRKWEDGTDPFDPAVTQPPIGGRDR